MESLEESPQNIYGTFYCSKNFLATLDGISQNAVWNEISSKSLDDFKKKFKEFQIIEKSKKLLELLKDINIVPKIIHNLNKKISNEKQIH